MRHESKSAKVAPLGDRMEYLHAVSFTIDGEITYTITREHTPNEGSDDIDGVLSRLPLVEGEFVEVFISDSINARG